MAHAADSGHHIVLIEDLLSQSKDEFAMSQKRVTIVIDKAAIYQKTAGWLSQQQ